MVYITILYKKIMTFLSIKIHSDDFKLLYVYEMSV